jgi:hypothetical protein
LQFEKKLGQHKNNKNIKKGFCDLKKKIGTTLKESLRQEYIEACSTWKQRKRKLS